MRCLSILLVLMLFPAPAPGAEPGTRAHPAEPNVLLPWWNGTVSNIGQNIACLSNPPILQVRTQAYAGYTLRPPNLTPSVGELFYVHLVMGHPGNPCAGSAIGIELLLPPGVQTAV